MKTIGLLGGMSWESTAIYYRLINEGVRQQAGGLHSAKIAMVSVDFHEIEELQAKSDWQKAGGILAESARQVQAAGADCLLLCTNTMHKVAGKIQATLDIPFIHLADATAQRILADQRKTIGLLGTRFTMEQNFYRGRLTGHGLDVLIPSGDDMDIIHRVIFEELCKGVLHDESRSEYLRVIEDLRHRGAEAIILGCTEIGILVQQKDTDIHLYDTTAIHADAAIRFALD